MSTTVLTVLRFILYFIGALLAFFGVDNIPDLNTIAEVLSRYWLLLAFLLAIWAWCQRRLFKSYPNTIRHYAANLILENDTLLIVLETIKHSELENHWKNSFDRWEARIRFFIMHRRKKYIRKSSGTKRKSVGRTAFIFPFYSPILRYLIEKGEEARKIQDNPETKRDILYAALIPCHGPSGDFVRFVDVTHKNWERLYTHEGPIGLFSTSTAADGDPSQSEKSLKLAKRIQMASAQVMDAAQEGHDVRGGIGVIFTFTRFK